MKLKNKLTMVISGAVVCGMLLSSSTGVFAAVDNKVPDNGGRAIFVKSDKLEKCPGMKHGKGHEGFTNMLSELVKDGTITQAESDKIAAFLKTKDEQRKADMEKIKGMTEEQKKQYFSERKTNRKDMLSELVENKIITQSKADAIKNKMGEKAEAKRTERIKEVNSSLEELVKKGTITKEQANKIIENMKAKDEERKAIHEKIKNMSPEEKKAYFEKMRGEKKSFLKDMVNKGELTQEQADAVREIIKGSHKMDK